MIRRFFYPRRSRSDIQTDVDEELRFHIDSRIQDLVARGESVTDARVKALREFGDIDDARGYLRSIDHQIESLRRRKDYMSDLRQDLRFAFRSLIATPAFTVVALLSLALGIGANTAIFSVVYGVLQRPLPFPHPEQLVQVWSSTTTGDRANVSVSALDVDDWRAQKQRFTDIGGYFYAEGSFGADLTGRGEPQRVSVAAVTPGFFSTLGVAPALGRLPAENEMVRGGDDKVVMLSHSYWTRAFGSDRSIVGQSVILGGEAYRVLGVMPATFTYPSTRVEVYFPFSTIPDNSIPRIRPVRLLNVVARMAPGVTQEQALAEMNSITADLAKRFPDSNASYAKAALQPLTEVITGPVKTPLMVLLAAVAFVLLMACVNIASLLLARATARTREVAVRVSLGATRSRIVRQLVTESLALASVGGVLGLLLAQIGTKIMINMSGDRLPRAEEIHIDAVVLAFAFGASLLAGLLFGVVPAIRASAVNLQDTLRAGSNSLVGGGQRLRSVLVVTQVAFAVVLAVGAALMTRSFTQLLQVNPGFKPDHLMAISFTISTSRHGENGGYVNFYQQVIERARATPGVISAAAAQYAPFRGMGERNGFTLPGQIVAKGEEIPNVPTQRISDGWFKTIGTPILSGREFTDRDRKDSPMVLVVNKAFARKYFGGNDPVGKFLSFGENANAEIVGMVDDIRQSAIEEAPAPLMYISNYQNARVKVTLVARTQGEPLAFARTLQNVIRELDKDQTITEVFTFDGIMNEAVARPRFLTVLFGAFGTIGLLLGAVGIYGVLAFIVSQRRREIGLRIALGANRGAVQRLVIRRGMILAVTGVTVGMASAFLLSRYIEAMLFGIASTDALTYVTVAIALVAIAALASVIPARRAARVDPLVALQPE